MFDFIIHGSGFKAFYWALKLRKKFPKRKIAIKSLGAVGGIYNSPQKGNFHLDYGCHLFNYTDKRFTDIFEIETKKIIPIKLKYATKNQEILTNNYGIFDFRNCKSFYNTLKDDFLNLNRKKIKEENLHHYFLNRHGSLVSQIINIFCVKLTGKTLNMIDKRSNELLLSKRILITNNKESILLKKRKLYDEIVAAEYKSVHDYSKKYIVYTFPRGNKGFLEHTLKLLKRKKIEIISNTQFAKQNLYTKPNNKKLNSLEVKIPLHICYFLTKNFPFTYLHDYSYNPIFRVSSPGHYSQQYSNGKSYVCLEIPDPYFLINKNLAIQLSSEYLQKYCSAKFFNYFYVKQSYPSLYLKGFDSKLKNTLDPYLYSKNSIMDEVDNFRYE